MIGVRQIDAFLDSAGVMHPTKELALSAELERAIGKVGNGEGLTPGIVKRLVENREVIGELLAAFGPVTKAEAANG